MTIKKDDDGIRNAPVSIARNTAMTAVVNGLVVSGRLPLEEFIALRKPDPGLLAASPDMPRGPHPGCIVESAAADAHDAIPRQPANPRAAFRANESGVHAPAIGGALQPPRLDSHEAEPVLGNNDPQ
jgi:hypothetical protein